MPRVQLYLGNCLEIVNQIDTKGAIVVTDPPYGCRNNCDYTRFTGGLYPHRNYWNGIPGDDQPFDPAPWLKYRKAILWGYPFFADRVPPATLLVWNKKRASQLGHMLSDCEIAWQSTGRGVWLFNHVWFGFDRESERGHKALHPSQKPVALMRWCIERVSRHGDLILDPYMGSGSCGVAAIQSDRNYIGIECVQAYFDVAVERIAKLCEPGTLVIERAPEGPTRLFAFATAGVPLITSIS